MRILITNDDGIHAPGLVSAEKIAQDLAGPDGEIWVVAPMAEMSGVAHCISYTKPVRSEKLGERRFSVDGTPADCVLVALGALMKDTPPDLVLSGVNKGNNSGENTLYSGTVGAVIEAALQGVRAVALSQYFGPENTSLDNQFEASEAHSAKVIETLLSDGAWGGAPYSLFYNINIPPTPAKGVKGTQVTTQGRRPDTNFSATPYDAPNRRRYYWIHGQNQHTPSAQGTDVAANLDGYISVTPCTADMTAHHTHAKLANLF
jgi:5'-nucleotidase